MRKTVVVAGSGISGAFAAYFLSGAGHQVIVVDPGDEQRRASFNNPGGINPLHGPGIPGAMAAFAIHSYRLHIEEWPAIAEHCGLEFSGRMVSRIFLAFSSTEEKRLKESAWLYQRTPGFTARWLDGDALRARDPYISSEVLGGLWTTGNAVVNPGRYNRAVVAAAQARGARYLSGQVTGARSRGGRVRKLLVDSLELPCDEVVLATGAWVDWINEAFGVALPVRPVRGELLLVERGESAPGHDLTWQHFGVYHDAGSRYWLGGTFDEVGFERFPTSAGEKAIVDGVAAILPELSQPSIKHRVAGLRPMTPDGMPIVGRVPGCDNAWLALGAGSKGMLLGTGLGKAVADMAVTGSTAMDVDFLAAGRFHGQPATKLESSGR